MVIAASSTGAVSRPRRLLRWLCALALLLAFVAVVLLALGPLGWREGWWHFRFAFRSLMPWAAYCGVAAAVLAVLALGLGGRSNSARRVAAAVLAFVVGGAIAYVPWHYDRMRGSVPPIHDITTDWQNPPQFQAILSLREKAHANPVAYEGAKVSDLQRRAYPEIAPLSLKLPPRDAFARALDTARQMGWTIVAQDSEAGRIEASQRSRWFGFTDDIVIRVAPEGSGSRVDIRSVSRVGRSDFGVNAARVRSYLAALRQAVPQ